MCIPYTWVDFTNCGFKTDFVLALGLENVVPKFSHQRHGRLCCDNVRVVCALLFWPQLCLSVLRVPLSCCS